MYPEDFECDEKVKRLDLEDLGFFLLCLNYAWTNDGLPPDFGPKLAGSLAKDPRKFSRLWRKVSPNFPVAADGRFRNPRQEDERKKSLIAYEGKVKGGKARWNRGAELEQKREAQLRNITEQNRTEPNGAFGAAFPVLDKYTTTAAVGETLETRAREEKKAVPADAVVVSLAPLLDQLADIYRQGGVPLSEPHRQHALTFLNALAPDQRNRAFTRLPDYCKWAFVSGRWNNPRMTKSLLNVLRDGDWDVELSVRKLPETETDLSPGERAVRAAERRFLRSKGTSC
jgi:hypothetical protein